MREANERVIFCRFAKSLTYGSGFGLNNLFRFHFGVIFASFDFEVPFTCSLLRKKNKNKFRLIEKLKTFRKTDLKSVFRSFSLFQRNDPDAKIALRRHDEAKLILNLASASASARFRLLVVS